MLNIGSNAAAAGDVWALMLVLLEDCVGVGDARSVHSLQVIANVDLKKIGVESFKV